MRLSCSRTSASIQKRTAAEELGVKDRGVLEEGKIADIVVLDANPLVDLHAFTEHLSAVYKEGLLV